MFFFLRKSNARTVKTSKTDFPNVSQLISRLRTDSRSLNSCECIKAVHSWSSNASLCWNTSFGLLSHSTCNRQGQYTTTTYSKNPLVKCFGYKGYGTHNLLSKSNSILFFTMLFFSLLYYTLLYFTVPNLTLMIKETQQKIPQLSSATCCRMLFYLTQRRATSK